MDFKEGNPKAEVTQNPFEIALEKMCVYVFAYDYNTVDSFVDGHVWSKGKASHMGWPFTND